MLQEARKTDNSGGVAAKERRVHLRYAVSATAEAVELHSDARIHGRISDIGRGGCYVEVMSPFAVGAHIKIKITTDDKSFVAKATVLYSTGGMGLSFSEIEPGQLAVLERWLAELSGEVAPEPKALKEDQIRSEGNSEHGLRYVLNELIIPLIRKRVLTDEEGTALLQKLMQQSRSEK